MIELAEQFFKVKNDPSQISVTEETMAKLRKIHPASLNEKSTRDGPVAWVLLLPTTSDLMNEFVRDKITEHELLEKTPPRVKYDAIYLCSALVLPEHRGKGLAKQLIFKALKSIKKQHQIKSLFCWSFSIEGSRLAKSVAKEFGLPLYQRRTD